MHFEVRVAQTQRLIHLIPLARVAGIRAIDLAVNRHPLVQSLGVEHHVIDRLGGGRDVDLRSDFTHVGALHITQGPFDGGFEAVQAHAEDRGGVAVAWQQVVFERLHQRLDQARVLLGDRRGDDRGDRREVERQTEIAGRSISITPAIRSSSSW